MNNYTTKYEMKQLFYSFFSKHYFIIGLFTKRMAKINISFFFENGTFFKGTIQIIQGLCNNKYVFE